MRQKKDSFNAFTMTIVSFKYFLKACGEIIKYFFCLTFAA